MIDKIQISVTTILDLIQEFDNTLRFGKPPLSMLGILSMADY